MQIHLPVDFVVGDKFAEDATSKVVTLQEGVPKGTVIQSLKLFPLLTLVQSSSAGQNWFKERICADLKYLYQLINLHALIQ